MAESSELHDSLNSADNEFIKVMNSIQSMLKDYKIIQALIIAKTHICKTYGSFTNMLLYKHKMTSILS